MILCDAHVHFFSPGFFRGLGASPEAISGLGWDDPVSPEALADRWVAELDRHDVSRASLVASLPGDADSVAIAIARHATRFVGFFMLDPSREDALEYATRALDAGLSTICLFPAMNKVPLQDPRVTAVFELAASRTRRPTSEASPRSAEGATPTSEASPEEARPCVFVHCGELSVGVRKRLGLQSPFDMTLGNPVHLTHLALAFPGVPIIIPHFGGNKFDEALALGDRCPNVYLDTSSSNSWLAKTSKGLSLADAFNRAMAIMGPDRLLFGTDSSFFPRGWNKDIYDAQAVALDELNVGSDVRSKIFGGNFARLFP